MCSGISRGCGCKISGIWLSWPRCFRTGYFSEISAYGEWETIEIICTSSIFFSGCTSGNIGIQWRKSEITTRNDRIDRSEKSRIAVSESREWISIHFSSELFSRVYNWIEFPWPMTTFTCHENYSIVVLKSINDRICRKIFSLPCNVNLSMRTSTLFSLSLD